MTKRAHSQNRKPCVRFEVFDYIIIGAGSAGCVLANRLTIAGDVRVLLLEAGGADDAPEIRVPAVVHSMFGSEHDWAYSSVPQKFTGRVRVPRGRTLGGLSSLNAMIYSRGNRADYNRWRDEYGAQGWGFDEILPYFVRSEADARVGRSATRHRWTAACGGSALDARTLPFVGRIRNLSRPPRQRRLQRTHSIRSGHLPGDATRRAAIVGRRRLPASRR
jgi:choline dehydrogenase-like flavoprotein